jgi:hypothetical protein
MIDNDFNDEDLNNENSNQNDRLNRRMKKLEEKYQRNCSSFLQKNSELERENLKLKERIKHH